MANPAPYMGTVEVIVCPDDTHVKELFTRRKLSVALKDIQGYWTTYLTFYGEQVVWIRFSIVDIRDSVVIWRNGQILREVTEDGKIVTGLSDTGPVSDPRAGQWLIGDRNAQWK